MHGLLSRQNIRPCLGWAAVTLAALFLVVGNLDLVLDSVGLWLDDSWRMVLNWTRDSGVLFGRDIVFTFGPLGWMQFNQNPDLQIYVLLLDILSLAVILYTLVRASKGMGPVLTLIALVALLGIDPPDLPAYGLALAALVLLTRERPTRADTVVSLAALALLGVWGNTKVLCLATALVAALSADAYRVLRSPRTHWGRLSLGRIPLGRLPLALPVLALAYVLTWSLAGQDIVYIPRFLYGALELTRGYSEAMISPLPFPTTSLPLFLVAFLLFAAFVLKTVRNREKTRITAILQAIPLILPFAFLVFMGFKRGFVRHDAYHTMTAFHCLVLAQVFWIALIAERQAITNVTRFWAMGVLVAQTAALALVLASSPLPGQAHPLTEQLSRPYKNLVLLLGGVTDAWKAQAQTNSHILEDIRAQYPLPAFEGPVDTYPYLQSIVLAHGLDYAPRPCIQSYTSYTRYLRNRDAVSLKPEDAPLHLLWDLREIDNRLPALMNSRSWPQIFTRYSPGTPVENALHLVRGPGTRTLSKYQVTKQDLTLGTWATVPDIPEPLWCVARTGYTGTGSVLKALWRPPVLYLDLELEGEPGFTTYRVTPEMLASGFLLSPLVRNTEEFAGLFQPNSPSIRVRRMRFRAAFSLGGDQSGLSGRPARLAPECYQPVLLRFIGLRLEPALSQSLWKMLPVYPGKCDAKLADPGPMQDGTVQLRQHFDVFTPYRNALKVSGWTVVRTWDSTDIKVYLGLRSREKTLFYKLGSQKRPDVTYHFFKRGGDFDHDDSGFTGTVPLSEFPPETPLDVLLAVQYPNGTTLVQDSDRTIMRWGEPDLKPEPSPHPVAPLLMLSPLYH